MAKRSSLRASDADRERVADRLREAASEGRLLSHELEERVARALRALTYGELDDVVSDLPGTPIGMVAPTPRRSWPALAGRHPLAAASIVLLGVVGFTVVAAVAVAMFASGLFILPLVFFGMARRRGWRGGPRGRRSRDQSGLGAEHLHVHVHRFDGHF